MSAKAGEQSEFEQFLSGLCIITVIVLIILALPIGLFVAAYLGRLKRLFFN